MLIDCEKCDVRNVACADCVVSVMLGQPPEDPELGPEERRALDVLAAEGLISRERPACRHERAS